MVLGGVGDHVDNGDWEWGGTTGYAAFCVDGPFEQMWSRVFDFGSGPGGSNFMMASNKNDLNFTLFSGGTQINLVGASFWTAGAWANVVGTAKGIQLFKDCLLYGPNTNGAEPGTVTRTKYWIGRSNWPCVEYPKGKV